MKVEVRSVRNQSGTGKSSNKPYSMDIAKCIIVNPDGSEAMGEIVLAKDQEPVTRGTYEGEIFAVDNRGNIEFRLRKLVPVGARKLATAS